MRSYEWKLALGLTILFMILMRLVWMDIRTYPPFYPPQNRVMVAESQRSDGCIRSFDIRQKQALVRSEEWVSRPSWGGSFLYKAIVHASCRSQSFDEQVFIRYNQGFLIATVFFAALLTRLLTSSWIVALLVAVALLSRGRLIASNGNVSPELAMSALLMLWAACLAHWLRSGSSLILLGSSAIAGILASLEPSFLPLVFVIILLYGLLRRSLQSNLDEAVGTNTSPEGHILKPLSGGIGRLLQRPELRALLRKDLWLTTGAGLGVWLLLSTFRSVDWNPRVSTWTQYAYMHWWQLLMQPFDRDLAIAAILCLGVLTARKTVPASLRALVFIVGTSCCLSLVACAVLDRVYLSGSTSRYWLGPSMLLVWEPLALTLGILSFLCIFYALFQKFWLGLQRPGLEVED